MENKTTLESCNFEFSQDAHSLSDKEFEEIEIQYVSSLGLDRDGEGYFVIKTEEWAVDNVDELKALFDRIEKVMKI